MRWRGLPVSCSPALAAHCRAFLMASTLTPAGVARPSW